MDSLKPHYRYMVARSLDLAAPGAKVLDFGCGKGDLVLSSLEAGRDAYGVEYFGAGSGTNIRSVLEDRGLLGARVLEYDGRTLPFDAGSFDLVVSNQVFEHVPDLPAAVAEIERVLKPGGHLLTCFPTLDSIREGHCGVPFAHRLPESRARYYYLLFFRSLGMGRLKHKPTKKRWAEFFNDWLTQNTHYRSEREIDALFDRTFAEVAHREDDYMVFRLNAVGRSSLAGLARFGLVSAAYSWAARRHGGVVLVARKGGEDGRLPEDGTALVAAQ